LEEPWTEKYRPKKLNDIVGQKHIVERLQSYVKAQNMPNLLFAGPPGVGKTTSALALARDLFGESYRDSFLELNASDERGIDVVRGQIKDFARTVALSGTFKIIFLDEADSLTSDAQHALRRTMEKYSSTTRFILSCNYSSKIIEPIQSRCSVFRFVGLKKEDMEGKVKKIASSENLKIDEKAIEAVLYIAEGDMRKAINILQGSAMLEEKINEKNVFVVSSRARPEEISQLIKKTKEGNFMEARNLLDKLMTDYGMSGEDVILQIYKETTSLDIDDKKKVQLVDRIGEYNFRMVEGANERIQLNALLAQMVLILSSHSN